MPPAEFKPVDRSRWRVTVEAAAARLVIDRWENERDKAMLAAVHEAHRLRPDMFNASVTVHAKEIVR